MNIETFITGTLNLWHGDAIDSLIHFTGLYRYLHPDNRNEALECALRYAYKNNIQVFLVFAQSGTSYDNLDKNTLGIVHGSDKENPAKKVCSYSFDHVYGKMCIYSDGVLRLKIGFPDTYHAQVYLKHRENNIFDLVVWGENFDDGIQS